MTKEEAKSRYRDLYLHWEGWHGKNPEKGILF